MRNKMKKYNFKVLNITNVQIQEALQDEVDVALQNLLKKVQSGREVDPGAFSKHTDAELLSMILVAPFQRMFLSIKDKKGFKKLYKNWV